MCSLPRSPHPCVLVLSVGKVGFKFLQLTSMHQFPSWLRWMAQRQLRNTKYPKLKHDLWLCQTFHLKKQDIIECDIFITYEKQSKGRLILGLLVKGGQQSLSLHFALLIKSEKARGTGPSSRPHLSPSHNRNWSSDGVRRGLEELDLCAPGIGKMVPGWRSS